MLSIRPYIRNFDSSEYMNGLANKETCIAMSWSADYAAARARAAAAGVQVNLAFTVPKEGANESFNALLIPTGAPHPHAAHRFLNFILQPKVIAEITNEIHYGNDNRAAAALRRSVDPATIPTHLSDPRDREAAVPVRRGQSGHRAHPHAHLDADQDRSLRRSARGVIATRPHAAALL